MARAYRASSKHADAVEAFEKAPELDPDAPGAWFDLGVAYAEQRRRKQAIEALSQFLQSADGTVPQHLRRAANSTSTRVQGVLESASRGVRWSTCHRRVWPQRQGLCRHVALGPGMPVEAAPNPGRHRGHIGTGLGCAELVQACFEPRESQHLLVADDNGAIEGSAQRD